MVSGTPYPVTPPGEQVIDFAFSPTSNEIAYRTPTNIKIRGIRGSNPKLIDSDAPPPAALDLTTTSIAWINDTLAYLTADGIRVVFLSDSGNKPLDDNSRLYINLCFSPTGSRLAVQSSDGGWSIFNLANVQSLQTGDHVNVASELAWFDDNSFVIAPREGGLAYYTIKSTGLSAGWSSQGEHYAKLITTTLGPVLAMHMVPGDNIGNTVAINNKGEVKSLGDAKIDSRAQWATDGELMYYVDGGTALLVNRASGAEDMLPVHRVARLKWGPIPPGPAVACLRSRICRRWE